MLSYEREQRRLEARARRVAHRAGFAAIKSRQRKHVPNLNNFGDFMLVDLETNFVVAGERFDMTPEEVIEFCTPTQSEK